MEEGQGMKPKLFQFWNTDQAPDEVDVLMRTWAEDQAFDYHRFNTQTADAFIATNFDSRTLAAYRKCAVPAMQSDFFRYCVLYLHGGVYVDAGTENLGGLGHFLEAESHGVLIRRPGKDIIPNGFMYFPNARDPLLKEVIQKMLTNIEQKNSNNVWLVTGPAIMSILYFRECRCDLFSKLRIISIREVRKFFVFKTKLGYKKENTDWRVAKRNGSPIFK
jgi:mannosyltransferase OCH1-like enzyme